MNDDGRLDVGYGDKKSPLKVEIVETPTEKPSWKVRRRVIFITLAFCAGVIAYCLYQSDDGKRFDTAITMAFISGFSIIGSYCFAATWGDNAPKK